MANIAFNGSVATITGLSIDVVEALKYNLGFYLDEDLALALKERTSLPLTLGESGHHLMSFDNSVLKVPTGLISLIIKKLKVLGVPVYLTKNVKAAELSKKEMNPLLRQKQKELVQASLKKKRGIVKAFTGSGKSYAISELLNQFTDDTNRLVLVPSVLLLYQMQQDIADYLKVDLNSIGIIGDSKCSIKPITVAIPDTLSSRIQSINLEIIEYLASVSVVVGDEAHTYVNQTSLLVFEHLTGVEYSTGWSATPFSNYPLILEGIFGPFIAELEARDGIQDGVIMKPIIEFHAAPPTFAPHRLLDFNFSTANWKDPKTMWAYNQIYDYAIVNNMGRNKLAGKLAYDFIQEKQGPLLVLVNKVGTSSTNLSAVSHADIFLELMREQYGIELALIHGKISTKNQAAIIQDLKDYKIPGAVATAQMLSTGISIKSLGGLILLQGGSGGPKQLGLIQAIGRLLRVEEGKAQPRIYDFMDPPIGGVQNIFANQSKKRLECAQQEYPDCVEVIQANKLAA